MASQAARAQRQTMPVRRIELGEKPADALPPLLFGPVMSRHADRTVMAGPAKESHNATFVLIEAARRPDIEVVLQGFGASYVPLYQGKSADDYARHAPYLAEIEQGSRAADWLIDEGWGKGWGVWLRSERALTDLRAHFRKFTQLYNPEEERWYVFRFYAPETARRILPSLPPSDFTAFTQGIAAIITSDSTGSAAMVI